MSRRTLFDARRNPDTGQIEYVNPRTGEVVDPEAVLQVEGSPRQQARASSPLEAARVLSVVDIGGLQVEITTDPHATACRVRAAVAAIGRRAADEKDIDAAKAHASMWARAVGARTKDARARMSNRQRDALRRGGITEAQLNEAEYAAEDFLAAGGR